MMKHRLMRSARVLAALGLATLAAPAFTIGGATLLVSGRAMAQDASKDTIIFRDGKTVQGTILEDTPTYVKMKVTIAGITSDATYQKTDILSVVKATAPAAPEKAEASKAAADKPPAKAAPPADQNEGRKKVYVMKLSGWFGEDISETPIRNSLKDAQKQGADVVIMELDNDWSLKRRGGMGDKKDDEGAFDELFRAEKMETIFTEEIPRWEKPPTVVIWVKKAMGGASFLPFLSKNIYFSSEGKMGGIGHLQAIFGSMGDKVVQEKQFALRLKHAEGKAIEGGYDPRIVDAMARDEYVLSVRFEGGKPVLLERMPESPDEILLTDDGKDANADDEETLARGEGNDCLTLKADIAYKLGISKGTADTIDDLVYQLGLSRTSEVVKGQSDQIMKAWRDGVADARRQLPKMFDEAQNEVKVKPPGGPKERNEARGRQRKIYVDMQQIEKKYEEALQPHRIPPRGVPDWNDLETLKKKLELEQLADKPEKKR
jgi:hypothetical protein